MNTTEENRFRPQYEKMQQCLVLQGLRRADEDTRHQVAADAWCAPGEPRSGVVETLPASTTGSVSQPGHGGAVPEIPPFQPCCAVTSLTTPNRV